jgi:hypothetical protein
MMILLAIFVWFVIGFGFGIFYLVDSFTTERKITIGSIITFLVMIPLGYFSHFLYLALLLFGFTNICEIPLYKKPKDITGI